MNAAVRTTWEIWRSQRSRTTGDRAFAVYAILMVGLVTVAPLGRAIWLAMTDAAIVAAATAPGMPLAVGVAASSIWIAALLAGRSHGTFVLPPFLAHALTRSAIPRRDALARPVIGVVLGSASVGALLAGALGVATVAGGASVIAAAAFVAVGAGVGVVAALLSLAAQAVPGRWSTWLTIALATASGVTVAAPAALPWVPWGWVALAYPTTTLGWSTMPLVVLALLGVAATPLLLDRLRAQEVIDHSVRWDRARTMAITSDVAGAGSLYRAFPSFARRAEAVRPARSILTVLVVRDAVGALRTPGRLVASTVSLVGAGVLLGVALANPQFVWALGAVAGVVAYAALGPLTDAVRHLAQTSSGVSLYGVSDFALLAAHVVLPLTVAIVLLTLGCVLAACVTGIPLSLAAPALAVTALAVRIADAFKPYMPIWMLTPMTTPVGDLSVLTRLAWTMDAVLFAAGAGAAAALITTAPVVVIATSLGLAITVRRRWAHRAS